MKVAHDTNRLKMLVAIASFGEKNLDCLKRIIERYRAMALDVDVVVTAEAPKSVDLGVEVVAGTPTKNPHSLPFAHKKLFADNMDRYDLFVYTEDDIDVSEANIRAFVRLSKVLEPTEIAGFVRYEIGRDGTRSLPDVHGRFHWRPESVRRRAGYVIAEFTNEHAGFYILTKEQLRGAVASGAFLSRPYEGRYEMLESAATDVRQLRIPKSHRHLPSRRNHQGVSNGSSSGAAIWHSHCFGRRRIADAGGACWTDAAHENAGRPNRCHCRGDMRVGLRRQRYPQFPRRTTLRNPAVFRLSCARQDIGRAAMASGGAPSPYRRRHQTGPARVRPYIIRRRSPVHVMLSPTASRKSRPRFRAAAGWKRSFPVSSRVQIARSAGGKDEFETGLPPLPQDDSLHPPMCSEM